MTGNVQIIRDAYTSFLQRDIPSVLAMFDPHIEWRMAEGHPYQPDSGPWIGPEAITRGFFMRAGSEWDGFTLTPSAFHEAGNAVIVECRYTGVYKPTGKRLDAQVCHIWKLTNGTVTSFQQYIDTAQLQDVMGAR
jgi:ketosteroid isomerase-like protein